ncbi:MAG: hypothetical protein ACYDIE_00540 [Candidatus Krumholzibacteriia bacterium]
MRKRTIIIPTLIGLAALGVALLCADPEGVRRVYRSVPRHAGEPVVLLDGAYWRRAVAWDFADGAFPGAWSWGDWRLADGLLEGRSDDGAFAVYVTPFAHGGDFLLETRVRLVSDAAGHGVEAHLLTRDGRELHSESGAVLFGGQRRVSVRHMVDGTEHVLRVVKPDDPVSEGVWHLLRFAVRGGRVEARLDGALLFRSDRSFPVGVYREPHFAVRYGVAQFSDLKIFVAP